VQTRGSVWRGASGYELVARRPAQRNDRFGIESVTKTFVAAVVLQLVGEGRLSLDESVERWLPGGVREGRRITIRELLNHTSGLASGMPTLFEPLSAQPPLLFRPGTSEAYANVNYVVLGAVVEKVTGRRLDRVVRDQIFRPLGLDDTSYGPTRVSRPLRERSWLGEPEVRTVPVTGDVGIVSTTADVAAFYSALLGGKVLSQAELSAMERTVATGTGTRAGLGLFRSSLPCGSAWGHGGNDDGYSDQVLVSDDGSKVVVVAQNALDEAATTAAAAAMYCAAP
jgi:D-alanyl-D-alanine carboxypeptidase